MLMDYLLHFLSGFMSVGIVHLTHLLFHPFPNPASYQFIELTSEALMHYRRATGKSMIMTGSVQKSKQQNKQRRGSKGCD